MDCKSNAAISTKPEHMHAYPHAPPTLWSALCNLTSRSQLAWNCGAPSILRNHLLDLGPSVNQRQLVQAQSAGALIVLSNHATRITVTLGPTQMFGSAFKSDYSSVQSVLCVKVAIAGLIVPSSTRRALGSLHDGDTRMEPSAPSMRGPSLSGGRGNNF